MFIRFFMLLTLALLVVWTSHVGSVSLKKQIINSLLLNSTYDTRTPPGLDNNESTNGSPTNVTVQMFIQDLYDVDVNEMDFSITCFLHQTWLDHRLKFDYPNITIELTQDDISNLWTPDTFFPQAKQAVFHTVTKPNALFHIKHDGSVIYSLRLQLKFSCNMQFYFYPLDRQTCTVELESYGLTSTELLYFWKENNPVVVENFNLPLYHVDDKPKTSRRTCHNSIFEESEGFSCLVMTIELERTIGFYMIEIFIPDMLIVILSWISFWLHPLAVPGRVSLGAVTVLTMASQSSASRRSAPRVSYAKAIDVWSLFQIIFVFAAMVEFSIVNVLARIKEALLRASQKAKGKAEPYRESQGNIQDPDKDEKNRPYMQRAKQIDQICRVAFPVAYLVFNFLFWVIVSTIS